MFYGSLPDGSTTAGFGDMLTALPCLTSSVCAPSSPFNLLRMDFAGPTNYVEIRALAAPDDFFPLWAFGSHGTLLGGCHIPPQSAARRGWVPRLGPIFGTNESANPCGELDETDNCFPGDDPLDCGFFAFNARIEVDNIAFAIVGGYADYWNLGSVDRIRYRSVPEPGTLALLAVGLLASLAMRRRSKAA
jgi:hypothetical protein